MIYIMTGKASELAQKVTADGKDYYKKMLFVSYTFHISTTFSVETVGC